MKKLIALILLAWASIAQAQPIPEILIDPLITRDAEIIPTGEANAVCITNTGTPAPAIALCSTMDLTGKTVLFKLPEYTVATLPATHPLAIVTDGAGTTDCTVGSGSTRVMCHWNGSAWAAIGGGAGVGDPGSNGIAVRSALNTLIARSLATASSARIGITNADGVAGNPTLDTGSDIPLKSGANTFTAANTFNDKLVVPRKATPGDLGLLTNGEVYIDGELVKYKSNTGLLYTLFKVGDPIVRAFTFSVDPTVDDDTTLGYLPSDIWINDQSTPTNGADDTIWIALSVLDGAANWLQIGSGSGTDTLNTVFARTAGNRIDGAIESKALELRGSGGGANIGFDFFTDSTNVAQFVCVYNSVRNDCDYYRVLANDKKWGIKDATQNIELEHTEDVGITAMTINAETPGVTVTIPEKKWFPFAACQNVTASLIWDSPTTNAAAAACITGTNTQKGVADFDATTDESLQMTYLLPSDFSGAIDAKIMWLAAATTGSVGWCVQLIKVSVGATDDPAFPAQATGNCVSDAALGTTLQVNAASITGVTCTDCAGGDLLHIQVSRDADGGAVTDDMTGDARGIGLELTIRRQM